MFIVTVLTFVVVALIPGDPAVRLLGAGQTSAQYHALDVRLGLTQSIPVQYWHWLDHVLHGSLGNSLFQGESVSTMLNQRLGVTISLVVGATLVSLVLGVGLGVASVIWRGPLGRSVDVLSWAGFAVPNFWLGLILIELLATQAKLLPTSGYTGPGQSAGHWLQSLVLPVLTLAAAGATGVAKQTRDSLGEVMAGTFIENLRMSGLSRRRVLLRHGLRNAAIPIVTTIGLFGVAMLGGTIVVEQIFALPGLGGLAVQAATDHDLPVIEGVVVYFTLIVVAINLIIDLSYARLNPRVRIAG